MSSDPSLQKLRSMSPLPVSELPTLLLLRLLSECLPFPSSQHLTAALGAGVGVTATAHICPRAAPATILPAQVIPCPLPHSPAAGSSSVLSKVGLPATVTKCGAEQGCQNASLKEGLSSSQKKTRNSGRVQPFTGQRPSKVTEMCHLSDAQDSGHQLLST